MAPEMHVALTDGGLVLVTPGGDLPSFTHDPDDDECEDEDTAPVQARAVELVDGGVHLAPERRVAHPSGGAADRLHVLGVRGSRPAGRWLPVDRLPRPFDTLVAQALAEHVRPPPGRPEWFRPEWHDRAEAWVDLVLADHGRRRTAPLVVHRVWSLSATFRVPTEGDDVWLKATCEHFHAEAAITRLLAERLDTLVPTLLGVHEGEGWLLMEPLRGTDEGTRDARAPRTVASAWPRAQLELLALREEFLSTGCPERGLEATLAQWRDLVGAGAGGLSADDLERLRDAVPRIEEHVRAFWGCGIPDTLCHGDLHLGNVAHDGDRLCLFDWSDACWSHPFLDGSHLAHFAEHDDASDLLVSTFAETWRVAFPEADVERASELAPLVDLVFQSVTYARIAAAGEAGAPEFPGVLALLSTALLEKVSPNEPGSPVG